MNIWRWLTTPDPNPGFTTGKLLKLFARVMIFAVIATLLSSLLSLTPLKKPLSEWWGSMLFILLLYIPMAKFMMIDTFTPRRLQGGTTTGKAGTGKTGVSTSAQRRKERNRFAGVKKSPPKYGGGRR